MKAEDILEASTVEGTKVKPADEEGELTTIKSTTEDKRQRVFKRWTKTHKTSSEL